MKRIAWSRDCRLPISASIRLLVTGLVIIGVIVAAGGQKAGR